MDVLTIIIIILSIGYVGYIIFERIYYVKLRKKIKHVILVNGIRGKSTVCRLIDAGLRKCGFRVYTKTTGTLAMIIDESNNEVPVKRLGPANIREQLKIMRKAVKANADVLVIECMAVLPELQEIVQQKMVNADIVVVTNVRPDHLGQMGDTLEELAMAFAKTMPKNGKFIIDNDQFLSIYQSQNFNNTDIIIAKKCEIADADTTFETFSDNLNLSLSVCELLNLSKETFIEGMKEYHHDFGAYQIIKHGNSTLVSAFAANDVVSTKMLFNETLKKFDKDRITILFNSRDDRPTRTKQFINLICELNCKKIILYGTNINYIKNKLMKLGVDNVFILKSPEQLFNEDVIFGIGNIKNLGIDLINLYKKDGEQNG